MEIFPVIKNGIFSGRKEISDLFLHSLKINQEFQIFAESEEIFHTVNGLLAQQKTRCYGLKLLHLLLQQCSLNKLEKHANVWLVNLMKFCNSSDIPNVSEEFYQVLGLLAKVCGAFQDLSKKFSTNCISKICDILEITPDHVVNSVLELLNIIMHIYPGATGTNKGLIQQYLHRFVDCDSNNTKLIGKGLFMCHVSLNIPPGLSLKVAWKNYEIFLVQNLGWILEVFYSNTSNKTYLLPNTLYNNFLPSFHDSSEGDTSIRLGKLYIRFHNVTIYLIEALRASLPIPKQITIGTIISLLRRGLSMHPFQLQQTGVFDSLVVAALVPHVHMDMLNLLECLIEILGNHLKLYANTIKELIFDVLRWTSSKYLGDFVKPFSSLRIKSYNLISLWCFVLQSGNSYESIAESLTHEILCDIIPVKSEMALQVLPGARQHLTKKARRQLKQADFETSNINKVNLHQNQKFDLLENGNAQLCEAAMTCLQSFLKFSSCFIKPTILKSVQTKLLQVCLLFYELPLPANHLYYNSANRKQVFECLYIFASIRHHSCPPPIDMIVGILCKAQYLDPCSNIRQYCADLIIRFENHAHPQKASLFYPINMQEVKKSFVLMGKGRLMEQNNFIGDTFVNTGIVDVGHIRKHYFTENELDNSYINNDVEIVMDDINIPDNNDDCKQEGTTSINLYQHVINLVPSQQNLFDETESLNVEQEYIEKATEGVNESINNELLQESGLVKLSTESDLSTPVKKKSKFCGNNLETSHVLRENSHGSPNEQCTKLDDSQLIAEIESEFVDELA